jgi:hypothetical protein
MKLDPEHKFELMFLLLVLGAATATLLTLLVIAL